MTTPVPDEDEIAAFIRSIDGKHDLSAANLGEQLHTWLSEKMTATPYGWVRLNPGFNSGVFSLGKSCPPGWAFTAVPVCMVSK